MPAKKKMASCAEPIPQELKKSVGGQSKYKPEFCEQAYKLAMLGMTDEELAAFFEVHPTTITDWKNRHTEFSQTLKKARGEADGNVAVSLYKRACGYSHPDVDIRTIAIGDGQSEIVKTPFTRHYPPDTAAAFIWLKNRQKDKWRNNPEGEGGGGEDAKVIDVLEKFADALNSAGSKK